MKKGRNELTIVRSFKIRSFGFVRSSGFPKIKERERKLRALKVKQLKTERTYQVRSFKIRSFGFVRSSGFLNKRKGKR
jgi:hypothetical protein